MAGWTTLVVPIQGQPETFVISRGSRLATLRWDGVSEDKYQVSDFLQVEKESPHVTRFNDGKCDPEGCLWAGTMGQETAPGVLPEGAGALYSFSSENGTATVRQPGITLSNGLGWSPDGSILYYIDTSEMKVEAFDCDLASKTLSGRRTVFCLTSTRTPGLPDGLTVDSRGRIWAALYFGGQVICIDPTTGQVAEQLHLPATNVTSCAWGGVDGSALYVTSATNGLADWQRRAQPDAGATFRVTGLGARGPKMVNWKVNMDALKAL